MSAKPIVLVTGGRGYGDKETVARELEAIGPGLVVEGGALGADRLCREWCEAHGVDYATFPALWAYRGTSAGPTRNTRMVEFARRVGCRLCLAFPGGDGTADCVRKAEAAGFEIRHVADPLRARVEADPVVRRVLAATGGRIERVEASALAERPEHD